MASGKTLQSTIEISGVLSPSLQAAIKNAVSKLEEMSQETLEAAGAAEKLSAEIGTQESVLKSLQKGYADYVVSGQESSDEARTLANKIQELSGELDDNRETLQAAERAAKGLTDAQGDTADAYTTLERTISSQQSELAALERQYASLVLEQGEGSEEAEQLARKITDLSSDLKQNEGALEAAQKAVKKLGESQTDTADTYDKLQKEISEQESDLTALRRQYANIVLEQGESSSEARQLASQISSLSGDLNENRQRLKEAEQAADSFGDALEDAGESAESSSEGYTVLKNVIANLATEAINKAVEAFKELATEGDTALGMLSARTGATAQELDGFEDVMYDVYNANYGESLGDVSEKLSTVIQMTDDLDKASLAQITKNAIALEDVFGFDITESMRAVNSLMDQFGITSDQAFNLLVQGAQKGLNQNDDLLDTINEYSVQFKNAGYSADDMFNMLANGAESGTWSVDKLGDAVKEFNIRMSDGTANDYLKDLGLDVDAVIEQFNKGGPEAQAAIGTVMEALMNCDDATKQYTDGVGLFGTMWEDLGADTVASLMDTEGAINSTADAMAKMDSAAYDTLESSLSQLGRTIKSEVVQPIAQKLTPVMKNAVNFVNAQVAPAVQWILSHLPEVGIILGTLSAVVAAMKWGSIVTKLSQIKGAITGVITALGGVSAPVLAVIAVVAALAAAFTDLWRNNEEFRDKITAIWDGIKGKFEAFGQTITDKLNELGFDFENFTEVLSTVWNGFCELLAPVFEGVFQQISNILSVVLDVLVGLFDVFAGIFTGDWDRVWEGVQEIFGGVWDFVVATFQNWIDTFKSLADTVLSWFGSSWDEAWSSVKSFFEDVWNGITSFFSSVLTGIKNTFTGIWDGIASFFSGILGGIKNTATSVWDSITSFFSDTLNGIKDKFTSIWESITSFLSGAWETIKNVVQVGIMAVKEIISAAFQLITLPFRLIWGKLQRHGSFYLGGHKVHNLRRTGRYKVHLSVEKLEAAKNIVMQRHQCDQQTMASSAWNAIKGTASTVWEGIKSTIGSKIDAAKERSCAVTGTIKSVASSAWSSVSSTASTLWETTKNNNRFKAERSTADCQHRNRHDQVRGFVRMVKYQLHRFLTMGNGAKYDQHQDQRREVGSQHGHQCDQQRGKLRVVNGQLGCFLPSGKSIRSTISSKLSSAKATVSSMMSGITSTMSSNLSSAFSTVSSKFSSIYSTISSKMEAAKNAVGNAISALKSKFNFSWSLPSLKLPHISISGSFSINPPSVPHFGISWYKEGGILTQPTIFGAAGNTLLAGGEAGAEAVVPLATLWEKLETMIRAVFNSASTTGGSSDAGLTSKAGELLTLDDFSLGSLADNNSMVIYYDFSGFTWNPQIQTGGSGDDEDDLMARLRAHEAEFFDWLEEFIQMREVAQYA